MKDAEPRLTPEFSRPLEVETLTHGLNRISVEARPDELAALAKRFELPGISALSADFELERGLDGTIAVRGKLKARATQTCVVTLDPVAAVIDEAFALVYAPAAEEEDPEDGDIDPVADDPPEAIIGGRIDLGEAAAAQLALALDPYPRKPGAAFDAEALGVGAERRTSPFAALGTLKRT